MGCPLSKSDRCPGSQPEAASSSSSTDENPGAYPTVNNFYGNEQQRKLSCNRRMSAYNSKGACYASNITSPYIEPKMDELLIHSHQRKTPNYQLNQMVNVDNYSTYDNRNDNPYYCSAWNESRASSSVNSVLTRFSKRVKSRNFDQRLLAHYDIKSLIGKGSFSRVVSAQHRATKLPVAIKVVSTKHGDGPLENELRILSQLRHPNVIKLLDVYKTPSRVYMVMQIAMGGELYERIVKCGHYGEQETALTLQMILDGLCYLHRCHIAHRDLKPENLLYLTPARDSPLIITDFGLASQKTTVDDPFMNEPCGTPEYIAPEILARVPYTSKVDVWAVGVLSYILLSGTMPFDDDNRTVMYRNILRGQYYFHYEVSAWEGQTSGISPEQSRNIYFTLTVPTYLTEYPLCDCNEVSTYAILVETSPATKLNYSPFTLKWTGAATPKRTILNVTLFNLNTI
uniref:Protein kinase domain-containing protein n=1 Tax=Romanomermis culicivorax TaxID=13658 RepID=A0A915KML9_ROMCU